MCQKDYTQYNVLLEKEQIKAKEVNETLAAEVALGVFAERWRADNDPNSQAHLGRDPSRSLDPMLSQFGIPAPQGRWGEEWGQGFLARVSFTQSTFPS